MLMIKKRRLTVPKMYLSSITDRLYGVVLSLYIFSHTALGWNADYALARRMCTAAYLAVSLLMTGQAIYNRKALLKIRYLFLWAAGFLFLSFLSSIDSQEPGASLRNLIRISLNFFFILILDYKVKDRAELKQILRSVVTGAVLAGVYVLSRSGFDSNGSYGRLGYHDEIGNIVNLLSHMSAFAMILNLYNIMESFSNRKKVWLLFYTVIEAFLFCIVLRTGSRTGMIMVVTGAASAVFLYMETRRKPFYILGGTVFCIAVFWRLSQTEMFQVLYKTSFENLFHFFATGRSIREISLNIRFEMIWNGLALWLEKPFFGWGIGTFSDLAGYGMYSHCDYVELLFGTGLAGTLVFYSLFIFSWMQLLKMKTVRNPGISVAVAAGFVILVSNFSAVTYNSFLMLVYMLYIYKSAVFENGHGLFRVQRYIV